MILPKRYYSLRVFDPNKWLSQFQTRTANEHTIFRAILKNYQDLDTVNQSKVHQAISPGAVRESLTLHSLLADHKAPSLIFQHIVDNVSFGLLPDLVETYLFRLMAAGNMNAVVSLVHIILQSDSKHYKLSNQFWSLLSSKASALGHHASASLVYHEIINPFINFTTEGPISEENEYVPFLLLPTAIEGLALVFAQNGNHIAVEGLRLYFKRYYSNFGHRDVYQTLYIAKVESLSIAGLFTEALDTFVSLAVKYRGHIPRRDPKDASHSLKYASISNYKERVKNISQNISFQGNNDVTSKNGIKPFLPVFKFNDYNIKGGPYWAIFDGVLCVEDLPNFRALMRDRIGHFMSHSGSVVDTLLSFISKYHYSICKFVVASLCDSGNCSRAIAVASKMPGLFPNINKEAYISAGEFTRIFKALERQFRAQDSRNLQEYHLLLMESFTLCQSLHLKSFVPEACFRSFLNCYFFSPLADMNEITHIVLSWRNVETRFITIDKAAYQQAISCGLSSLKLLTFIRISIT